MNLVNQHQNINNRTEKKEKRKKKSPKKADIQINFCTPPIQVAKLHQLIKEKITECFSSKGYQLIEATDAPAIGTVINNVNVLKDIKRDMLKVSGIKVQIFLQI